MEKKKIQEAHTSSRSGWCVRNKNFLGGYCSENERRERRNEGLFVDKRTRGRNH